MSASKLVARLSFLTGAGILLQWVLVWIGAFPVEETTPGFRAYFLSFAAADLWLVLVAFLTVALTRRGDPRAVLSSAGLGSAMVFFGLYALLYDFNIGVLFELSAQELFGKSVTLYNLVVGLILVALAWRAQSASLTASHPAYPR